MGRRNGIIFLIILVIFAFTLWVVLPTNSTRLGRKGLRLGLDLVGGVELTYRADFSANATASEQSSAMSRVLLTVTKRIDAFGVVQPLVQKVGSNEVDVQLPGYTDKAEAEKLVEQTGFLEFRVVEKDASGNPVYLSNYVTGNNTPTNFIDTSETGSRVFVGNSDSSGTQPGVAILTKDSTGLHFTDINGNAISTANLTKYSSSPSWIVARGDDGTPLTGALLSDAQPNLSSTATGSQPVVDIKWNSQGTDIFNQIAARIFDPQGESGPPNLTHDLGIFLDNNLLEAPKVNNSSYSGGQAVIQGNFTMKTATDLANLLKSGALPVKLTFLNSYDVSATLGALFKSQVVKAGFIGVLLVMLFMIIYYRLPGLLASLALIFYGTACLAVFKLLPVTLDLGALGGFIASLGMAVDANVLIFERMREEFRTGRTLGAAIDAGFHRAWSAIRDSNLTTILACIILYWLGTTSAIASSAVKGFSLTLAIGVLISMFTAITVTRTLLSLFIKTGIGSNHGLFLPTGGKK
ncbi:MAG TPA: protein translocase subunit SecD [Dehalococcoidales bacterium]|nr:protein translocase subunit SecD [Dehalococcoidales bacterium]